MENKFPISIDFSLYQRSKQNINEIHKKKNIIKI
jgi:hypothetical protein